MQTNVRLSPSDMNDFSLRDRHTDILSTTLGEHHVQNLITLKLDEIKIFWNIYVTIGQTFCDRQTLLHTFFGFPGACSKVTFSFYRIKDWTFLGL